MFQCPVGSPPATRRAGCHHPVCPLQKWDLITTSVTSSRTSGEEAARAPFSWTTEYLATAETDARKMDRRPRRGPTSGRGTSRENGRGCASWTGSKRDGTVGKGRAHVPGAETWGSARSSQTVRSCVTTTAAKTSPLQFMRSTTSLTAVNKFKLRRAFTTLFPQPGRPTKDTHQVLQASICIQPNSSRLCGRGTYRRGSGGGRRRLVEDWAPAAQQVLGMNWRGY